MSYSYTILYKIIFRFLGSHVKFWKPLVFLLNNYNKISFYYAELKKNDWILPPSILE